MSKCESQLRNFIKALQLTNHFPKESVSNFLAGNQLNANDFQKIYAESREEYMVDMQNYREVTLLLFMGLSKNVNGMIENAIEFVEGMILSRFIMLIFNEKLEFQGDKVLLFLEPTLELTVVRALESGKEQLMLVMLEKINSKKHVFNEIGFLLEMTLIKKIQKYLDDSSLYEFNELLKGFLHSKKISRIFSSDNSLHFRQIVFLRQQEEKQDTYFLQFMSGGKLAKLKQPISSSSLPKWVVQAFWKLPRFLDVSDFHLMSVTAVYRLFSELEVFASSPLVEELDSMIQEDSFIPFFQPFLMGTPISRQPYQFHWQKMRKSLDILRQNSQIQNPCYKVILAEEMLQSLGGVKTNDAYKHK